MVVGDRDSLKPFNLEDASRIPNCALQVYYRVGHMVPWDVPQEYWRLGQVVWGLTGLLLGLWAVIGYLGWRQQSADEASLFLRDTLWAETRREQRRIQRWTAWAKWRVGR